MGHRLMNEGLKWLFFSLWLIANIAIFIATFLKFYTRKEYYYTREILREALPIAKGSAAGLNLNSMLILIPVCRNLISFLRGSVFCQCCKRNVRRQLDKNIAFHKLCAYMICFWTIIHYFAHTFNFERYWLAHESTDNSTGGLYSTLSNLPSQPNGTWINPIRPTTSATNPMLELVKNIAGYTGVIITIPLILIMSSATEIIRRSYFEVFWYTHHLFIVYYIGLVTHGLGNVVRLQINIDDHDPEYCKDYYEEWGTPARPECPIPQFSGDGASSWKWVLAPILLYIVERIMRFVRGMQMVTISKVIKHPSQVIELQMRKPGFTMEAGQYIQIQCPSISRFEWHPFTLTSSPKEDFFSIHIRLVGDWTNALAEACHVNEDGLQDPGKMPRLAVDGPYGTCSEDAYRYQTVMFVGAGIGVTPFAAILKDIWYKHCDHNHQMKLTKVYFYWISSDTHSFEWFADLLGSLEDQMENAGKSDLLTYNIFLTRGWNTRQALNIVTNVDKERDVITNLKHKTQFGRPKWEIEFDKIARMHQGTRIGVFFCGPKSLSKELHNTCNRFSDASTATHFVYNKENF
ncbi:hypothetical protein LSH36_92g01022 [Paralvinella palmiformis]|uniref:FAD-binding FR-type domain-containing protein n=1 Tax=Paralvinella palmiformis TaxID=53620 RepID=A0AAD9NAC1_9ANNE|nr:hypothetical protein LSH36_92g01022 [Paralvinella palmiformis]